MGAFPETDIRTNEDADLKETKQAAAGNGTGRRQRRIPAEKGPNAEGTCIPEAAAGMSEVRCCYPPLSGLDWTQKVSFMKEVDLEA
jgi:hypothetical protein